jgi:murein DD-endopeptidase MepM/ murein hydrolase activator NlpD
MNTRTPFWVRLSLWGVRRLLFLKRVLLVAAYPIVGLFRFLKRGLMSFLGVPIYRLIYVTQRRLATWYGSAKNRLMFFLCNKFTSSVVALGLVVVAVGGNVSFASARTDTFDFGTRSLLYAVLHPEDRREIVEEVVRPIDAALEAQVAYVNDPVLRPVAGYSWTQSAVVPVNQSLPVLYPAGEEPLPPRRETVAYVVEAGDTLSTIAQKFEISLNTLLWANNLTTRSAIKPGQTLRVLPVTGLEHTVARNQTLSSISKLYSVDLEAIRALNGLNEGEALSIGRTLILPGAQKIAPTPRPRTVPSVGEVVNPTKPLPRGETAPSSGATMVWPTDLHYLVRGLKWGHTGIDLDCNGHADGTSTNYNYAAQDGVVQYSGWRRGYGNTVEIDHGNGLVTRYGHFHTLAVKSGQTVGAGEALGVCGSTGNSTGTHLHFEVIANGRFMNPFDYLR